MLACARIGAPHVVVFGGFSAESLGERLESTGAKAADHPGRGLAQGRRRSRSRRRPTRRVKLAPTVESMVVLRRTGADVPMQDGRDHWWHDAGRRPARHLRARAGRGRAHAVRPAHVGHDGQAEGRRAHLGRLPHLRRRSPTAGSSTSTTDDVWWCAADIGWVTGHSYIVYGPLANGATGVLYEGDPMYPGPERHWQIIESYSVTQYYTAPTLIRAFIKAGPEHPGAARPDVAAAARHGRRADQPRGVGLVLEVHRRRALPDRRHVVADRDRRHPDHAAARRSSRRSRGRPRGRSRGSRRRSSTTTATRSSRARAATWCITRPWPGMFRTLYRDDERYVSNYFSRFDARHVLPRRRRPPGRRRLLLAARAGSTT